METIGRRITVFASVAVMAFGGAGVAQAKHGSDDPVKEVRGGHGADDASPHARHGADDRAGHRRHAHRRHAHRRHHARHGADDPAGHR
jgi:hypothetical protein